MTASWKMSSPAFAKNSALTLIQDPGTVPTASHALWMGLHWNMLAKTEAVALMTTKIMHPQIILRKVFWTARRRYRVSIAIFVTATQM